MTKKTPVPADFRSEFSKPASSLAGSSHHGRINMPVRFPEAERGMDADLEQFAREIEHEKVPERLQVLAAQLRAVLLQQKERRKDAGN